MLSAQKKLVVEKLAEEEAERKNKGEAKKEKHLVLSNFPFSDIFCFCTFSVGAFQCKFENKCHAKVYFIMIGGRKGTRETS